MEIWKDIVAYEGMYQVSDLGRVKSLKFSKLRLLKNSFDKDGYLLVSLYKNGKQKTITTHRLVAQSFIYNKDKKPQVNHINGIKDDNRVQNLEWNTSLENIRHSYKNGLKKGFRISQKGGSNPNSKLTQKQVLEIRESDLSVKKLCSKYNVKSSCIYRILKNESWIL